MKTTVLSLLRTAPDESIALTAPGRLPLEYGELRRFVGSIHRQLAGRGIGAGDRWSAPEKWSSLK